MSEYLPTFKEYCEKNGLDYEKESYLEPYFNQSQNKVFGFIIGLLI